MERENFEQKKPKLYKNKFLIALYDENEMCVEVADNPKQLLQHMGFPLTKVNKNRLYSRLGHCTFDNDGAPKIRWFGRLVEVHLIEFDSKEEE